MRLNDLTWMIGGEAGFGIQSAGHVLALCAMRGGLHVFGNAEYPSLIRGGHNSNVIRVCENKIGIHKEKLDLLLAMNKETLDMHLDEIVEGGGFIYDAEVLKEEITPPKGVNAFNVPLKKLALEVGKGDITRNIVGIGASFGLLDYDMTILNDVLKQMFGKKKGQEIVENNIAAAKAGYDFVKENYEDSFEFKLKPLKERPKRMLITANDAVCMGALKAGCKFVAEYPMTPSSSILHFMAAHARDYGIVVKHTEDELAAINMVVGAGYAGVRAMTGTSGGGFSLMVEALGMAGMLEVPLVCVEVQRPGPSTGLPTRTEQSDLKFAINASHGEFPKIVLAPGEFDKTFYLTFDAFNLAERYQLPVIILLDKHMAESVQSVDMFEMEGMEVDRGKLLTQQELDQLVVRSEKFLKSLDQETPADRGFGGASAVDNYLSVDDNFLRYKFEKDGVSFRTIPGMEGGIHRVATDEHDESGDLTETEENRTLMMQKRANKLEEAIKELPAPSLY
jgi:2-oxoglutarate/2-oxoacid ferredoxin oxidoreductase subunit alpha